MKLTKNQFALFCEEVQKWRDRAGLLRWSLSVGDEVSNDDSDAECWGNLLSGIAGISIKQNWDSKPSDRYITQLAFHEVMELLLLPLSTLAEERFCTENQLEMARHDVIRTLEHLLWKPDAPK